MFGSLEDELCVFGELGWIDSEMNFDNATYNADIARFVNLLINSILHNTYNLI